MQVWTWQCEHTAAWTGQPLPPAQSSSPSYLFIPGAGTVPSLLRSELAPRAFPPYWFVSAVFINTSRVCFPLIHEAPKSQNCSRGYSWRSLLQPHCYGRVTQSSLLRAVFSQLLNYLQSQKPPQPVWATCQWLTIQVGQNPKTKHKIGLVLVDSFYSCGGSHSWVQLVVPQESTHLRQGQKMQWATRSQECQEGPVFDTIRLFRPVGAIPNFSCQVSHQLDSLADIWNAHR